MEGTMRVSLGVMRGHRPICFSPTATCPRVAAPGSTWKTCGGDQGAKRMSSCHRRVIVVSSSCHRCVIVVSSLCHLRVMDLNLRHDIRHESMRAAF